MQSPRKRPRWTRRLISSRSESTYDGLAIRKEVVCESRGVCWRCVGRRSIRRSGRRRIARRPRVLGDGPSLRTLRSFRTVPLDRLGQPRKRFARALGCVICIHSFTVLRITVSPHFTPNFRERAQIRCNNFARDATRIGKPRRRRTTAVPKLNTVMNVEIRKQTRANRRIERRPHATERRYVATSTEPRLHQSLHSIRFRRLSVQSIPPHPKHEGRRLQRLCRARAPHFDLRRKRTCKRQPLLSSFTHSLQHRCTLGGIHSHRLLLRVLNENC